MTPSAPANAASQLRRRRCISWAIEAEGVATGASIEPSCFSESVYCLSVLGRCGASARRAVRGVAAAERAHQVDAESEAARAQLRAQPLGLDHLILAREHAQVVVEAGAIALAREIVGALRGLERNLLLGGLALERPPVRDHVGDLAHRIEQDRKSTRLNSSHQII